MATAQDDGETLIEILVTLMLVGIGVAAVLGALMTGFRGSRSTQLTADGRATLVAAAEQIQAADYVPCAGLNGYNNAIAVAVAPKNSDGTNVSTTTVTVRKIAYWTGAQGFADSTVVAACAYENTAGAVSRLQRITLQASSDENLTIVKKAP